MPWSVIGWAVLWHLGAVILIVSLSLFARRQKAQPILQEIDPIDECGTDARST
jgi:hypothetical protein